MKRELRQKLFGTIALVLMVPFIIFLILIGLFWIILLYAVIARVAGIE